MVALKPKTSYKTYTGQIVNIGGLTKNSPTEPGERIFWSIAGNWYREDGAAIGYDKNGHFVYRERAKLDLVCHDIKEENENNFFNNEGRFIDWK